MTFQIMNIYDNFGYESPSEMYQSQVRINPTRIEQTKVPQLLAPQNIHDALQQYGKRLE